MPYRAVLTALDMVDGLTDDPKTWEGSSLLSVSQITPQGLGLLLQKANEMKELVRKHGGDDRLKHRILATVFYEASTRTCCSFQAAMKRLGGEVIHVDADGTGNSSSKKGEALSDTINCLESYADVTVLRHPVTGSVADVVMKGMKPVVNAGDGVGEHPSQALLDFYTICNELKYDLSRNGSNPTLVVVLLGDLKHGRTVHSLAKLLARSRINVILRYCSPSQLEMTADVQEYVSQYNVEQQTFTNLEDAIDGANVLYVTRIQKERFEDLDVYYAVKDSYIVDTELMKKAPEAMIVMHPLPRVREISMEVDSDPRAAYFRQMENGMFVRMALLALIMGKA